MRVCVCVAVDVWVCESESQIKANLVVDAAAGAVCRLNACGLINRVIELSEAEPKAMIQTTQSEKRISFIRMASLF